MAKFIISEHQNDANGGEGLEKDEVENALVLSGSTQLVFKFGRKVKDLRRYLINYNHYDR